MDDRIRGVIERDGLVVPEKPLNEMSDEELAEWLANAIGVFRGARLDDARIDELKEIVSEERRGVEKWLIEGYLMAIHEENIDA